MMKKRIAINPFSVFFFLILLLILVYSLGWSEVCPPLSSGMWTIFLIILVSLFFLSKVYEKKFPIEQFKNEAFEINKSLWGSIALFSMIVEFIYEKSIPIVDILILKNGYNYVDFEGIPIFHVFAVTFTSFFGLYLWDQFLLKKKWTDILMSLFFISYPIMLFNRGGLIMNICTLFFIFILRKREIILSSKIVIQFIIVGTILLYGFGIFGNIRSSHLFPIGKEYTNTEYILITGQATEEFKNSNIPKPFFWAYLYASTPIANLQNIVQEMEPTNDTVLFITQTMVPDFIAKRIEKKIDRKVPEDALVNPVFNVSTFFAPAYKLQGVIGLFLIFYFYVILIFVYSSLMKKLNTTKIVGLSILYTITIFNLFTNMMIFSGLSFQLFYPIMFWIYKKIK